MSSITRVLHTTTWVFFAGHLPELFSSSPKEVMEVIMADINDLVKEFWKSSSDGAVGTSLIAMRRLFEIMHGCLNELEVCFNIISVFVTAVDLANKNLQRFSNSWALRAKFKILIDGYRKMLDRSFSQSKDLGDTLRFLPGVVVQKLMSTQGMADLYRIKPDLLKRIIKFLIIEPLGLGSSYALDGYLFGFLQDPDRSQLHWHHCDPMLQHISLCRHFLSLSNAFDVQS